MKNLNRNRLLLLLPTVVLGAASLFLYRYMMDTCFDSKGLLISGNWPNRVLVVIGAVYAVYLLAVVRGLGGDGTYEQAFPRCILSGCLVLAGGAELYISIRAELAPASSLELYFFIAAAASMAVTGACRMFGRRPWFVFNGIVCLFFMFRMVSSYRTWSADPQLQDYAYQMMACCLLMLAAFHRTCCDAGIIDRKKVIVTCLGAAFCCLASLNDKNMVFYLASGLWAAGSLCSVAWFPEDAQEEAAPTEVPQPEAQAQTLDQLIDDARKLMGDQ